MHGKIHNKYPNKAIYRSEAKTKNYNKNEKSTSYKKENEFKDIIEFVRYKHRNIFPEYLNEIIAISEEFSLSGLAINEFSNMSPVVSCINITYKVMENYDRLIYQHKTIMFKNVPYNITYTPL